jgi:hypothetical protein
MTCSSHDKELQELTVSLNGSGLPDAHCAAFPFPVLVFSGLLRLGRRFQGGVGSSSRYREETRLHIDSKIQSAAATAAGSLLEQTSRRQPVTHPDEHHPLLDLWCTLVLHAVMPVNLLHEWMPASVLALELPQVTHTYATTLHQSPPITVTCLHQHLGHTAWERGALCHDVVP